MTRTPRSSLLLTSLLVSVLAACGGGSGDDAVDAPPTVDAAPTLPSSCTDACAVTNAVAMFGAGLLPFERGFYGLTTTATGPHTLHVEAYSGGDASCTPSAPDATLILDQVAIPSDTAAYTTGAGLVDLTGLLLPDQPTASTDDARVTPTAWVDGEAIAFDVSATFASGTVIGHVYAVHCPAMDAAQ